MSKYLFSKLIIFISAGIIIMPVPLVMAETLIFDSNIFTGETHEAIMNDIKNEQCPCKRNFSCNKKMVMPKIFKAGFVWDGAKPLVFPDKQKYKAYKQILEQKQAGSITILLKNGDVTTKTMNLTWGEPAKQYSQLSLRLIPHHILNVKFDNTDKYQRSFLDGYLYSIYKLIAFNNNATHLSTVDITISAEVVAEVFKKLTDCCNPPVNPATIPTDLNELKTLIADTDSSRGRLSKRVDCTDLNLDNSTDCR